MRLLWRFGIFIALFGFLGGWLLRRRAGGELLPQLVLLGFLPWLFHLGYVLVYAFGQLGGLTFGMSVVGVLSAAVARSLLRFGPRFYRSDVRLSALLPPLLAFFHLALVGAWVASGLRAQGVMFGTFANLYYVGATLFISAALYGYTFGAGRALSQRNRSS